MQVGQAGTARNGQRGVITEAFANGGVFKQDNGVQYVVLSGEFIADGLPLAEHRAAVNARRGLFRGIREGFHYINNGDKGFIIRELRYAGKRVSEWYNLHDLSITKGREYVAGGLTV